MPMWKWKDIFCIFLYDILQMLHAEDRRGELQKNSFWQKSKQFVFDGLAEEQVEIWREGDACQKGSVSSVGPLGCTIAALVSCHTRCDSFACCVPPVDIRSGPFVPLVQLEGKEKASWHGLHSHNFTTLQTFGLFAAILTWDALHL